MSNQYKDIKAFFEREEKMYELVISEEEFIALKAEENSKGLMIRQHYRLVKVRCFKEDHITTMTIKQYSKRIRTKPYELFCSKCDINNEETAKYKKKIHKEEERKKDLEFSDIKETLEIAGLRYFLTRENYNSKKQKIPCLCKCGNPCQPTLSDIKAGNFCNNCNSIYNREYEYKFPSGIVEIVQGYEGYGIDYLLNNKNPYLNRYLTESDILLGLKVQWFDYITAEGKNRHYHPDIQIRNTNIIIEIKSVYTYSIDHDINYRKFIAVTNNDYIIDVMIFSRANILFDIWHFSKDNPVISLMNRDIKDFNSPIPSIYRQKDLILPMVSMIPFNIDFKQINTEIPRLCNKKNCLFLKKKGSIVPTHYTLKCENPFKQEFEQ